MGKKLRQIKNFFENGQKWGEQVWNEELGKDTSLLQVPTKILIGSKEERKKKKK